MDRAGPRRWHDQRWLIDEAIASRGIEFDQNRLRYSLGPGRDETSAADIGILRASITKLADLTPVASVHAQRHEDLARRLEDRGLADRVDPAAAPADSVHERVTRDGRVVPAGPQPLEYR